MSTLKADLKAWEASFRAANNGRDPTKADIKLVPDIAAKYKEYNKAKSSSKVSTAPAASTSTSHHPSSSTSNGNGASSSRPGPAPPSLAPNVFKTPTKPKPKRRQQTADVSPAKSTTSNGKGAAAAPTYVIANSPSKLRALAAAHSTFGSPNKSASTSGATSGTAEGVTVVGSPKKYNPFAAGSPVKSPKKRGLFEEQIGERQRSKVGKGKTKAGRGWGDDAVEDGNGWESIFSSSSTAAVRRNGGGARTSSSDRMEVDAPSNGAAFDDDDDEMLGPSPVKPSAAGRKEFKPLFSTATTVATSSQLPPALPKLFQPPSKATSTAPKAAPNQHPALPPNLRGVKRPQPALAFDADLPPPKETGKALKPATKKTKVAGGTNGKGKTNNGRGKGKAKVVDSEDDSDEEASETAVRTQAKDRQPRVVEMEVGEEGDKVDRVTIHPRRPYFKGTATAPKDTDDAIEIDGDGAPEDEEDLDDEEEAARLDSQGSLFYRDTADLLASQEPTSSAVPPSSTYQTEDEEDDLDTVDRRQTRATSTTTDDLLPTELSSILSLRSSPIKKTAQRREKERDSRVTALVTGVSRKKTNGLVDLPPEVDEDGQVVEEGEEGEDDDWASDPDGWKEVGDGEMDGYDDWP